MTPEELEELKKIYPPPPPMTTRQHIARGLGLVFFMPVAYVVQVMTSTPGPNWIYKYGKVFEWIAGKEGFRW